MKQLLLALATAALLTACAESPRPPETPSATSEPSEQRHDEGAAVASDRSTPVASDKGEGVPSDDEIAALVRASPSSDPLKGRFTLAQATAGLSGEGPLTARIKTSLGTLRCTLEPEHAPRTVANFVGLARGKRPWKSPDGAWVLRPAYDGTSFHRIIPGFMIQGGDPTGTGIGEPGYMIPDEGAGAHHDRAGLLCMANRGPNTNGMQFFVTDASTPHLDRGKTAYTIFGACTPLEVVHAIAAVPTGVANRPTSPVAIESVTIER